VIDKLDLRVPKRTGFTAAFDRLYPQLRTMEKGPFRASKYYEFAGNLREFNHDVRLNLFCRMQKSADHKIELLDVGTKTLTEIIGEVSSIFDVDARSLRIMRVDLAVDVEGVPLSWFREALRVSHKRWRAAVTGDRFYGEMGNRNIQTLYYGKRPNLFRVYDKMAEYRAAYQRLKRGRKGQEPPSFEALYGRGENESVVTRVERQIGGRIPERISTLHDLIEHGRDFEPFQAFHFATGVAEPLCDTLPFETRCTAEHLRNMAAREGMQAVASYIKQWANGNDAWAWKKYGSYLRALETSCGISSGHLQGLFETSMTEQLAA